MEVKRDENNYSKTVGDDTFHITSWWKPSGLFNFKWYASASCGDKIYTVGDFKRRSEAEDVAIFKLKLIMQ